MRDKFGRFIKGHKRPQEFIKKHRQNMLGHFVSEETRKKIGLANSKPRIMLACEVCKKEFSVWPSQAKSGRKLCSLACSFETRKGRKAWNKGLIGWRSGEKRPYMKGLLSGEKNPAWKGNDILYRSLHSWVTYNLGKPNVCENCGESGLNGRQIHWANKSRKYEKDLSDWIRLCVKCHKAYDRAENQVALTF